MCRFEVLRYEKSTLRRWHSFEFHRMVFYRNGGGSVRGKACVLPSISRKNPIDSWFGIGSEFTNGTEKSNFGAATFVMVNDALDLPAMIADVLMELM